MPNTVSVERAALQALVAWLGSQLSPTHVSDEWPDAGVAIPTAGIVSVVFAGACDETPVRPPHVLKQVNDPSPAVTANFYFRTHFCAQPLQLDVWATDKYTRDDLVNRLGDALTAGPRQTLSPTYFTNEGIQTNQDPAVQSIILQLAAPWDHLVASYSFDAPEREDTTTMAKEREYRAIYRGQSFFDRTVIKNVARLLNVQLPIVNAPTAQGGGTLRLTVTPTGRTITRG